MLMEAFDVSMTEMDNQLMMLVFPFQNSDKE